MIENTYTTGCLFARIGGFGFGFEKQGAHDGLAV